METSAKWYTLYTKPRWEKKVADVLSSKNIENYCPVNRVYRQWSDRKKMVNVPLFTGYVFVKTDEKSHLAVRSTTGVINFVYWLTKPAVIREEEIALIKKFLNEFENVQLERVAIENNDTVRVTGGVLTGLEGMVLSASRNAVKVLLPSLGFMMVAELSRSHVELIQRNQSQSTIMAPISL
ncbi:MAG TPA: UpxY family transcription antiterminator [Puia sp.]|jgi:transcription antitermination factor NusG|nr:UpxY family transcription antiterminator [Puia sp.]